jgi:nucleotidyltransferase/DNA polymerase involved in DNA repair
MPTVQIKTTTPTRTPAQGFAALILDDPPTWTLERGRPELRSVPLVVVHNGRVVGLNTQARDAGVRCNDDHHRARALVGERGQLFRHNPDAVRSAWSAVLLELYTYSPRLESKETGRALLGDLTPDEAQRLASSLHARVGLAASRSSATLAALSAAPGTARIASDEPALLDTVPISWLVRLGVEPEALRRLELLGVSSVAALHRFDLRSLQSGFGKMLGSRLHAITHGLERDPIPVWTPPLEVQGEIGLDDAGGDPAHLEGAVLLAAERAVQRLRGYRCASVRLELHGSTWKRSRRWLPAPTDDEKAIRRAARAQLEGLLIGEAIGIVRVVLEHLERPIPVQDSLFDLLERPRVREAIRRVHARHPNTLGRLEIHRPRAMLPELRSRFVPLTGLETPKARGKR